jgi:ADP-ribosylation factor-binding protein GGA
LQINDQINTVLNRYEAFKKGDYVTSSNPIPAELAANAAPGGDDLSLIDFDESLSPKGGSSMSTVDELGSIFGPSLASSSLSSNPAGVGPIGLPTYASPMPLRGVSGIRTTPSHTPPLPQVGSIMLPGTPQPPPQPQPQPQPQGGKDPFADLAGLF